MFTPFSLLQAFNAQPSSVVLSAPTHSMNTGGAFRNKWLRWSAPAASPSRTPKPIATLDANRCKRREQTGGLEKFFDRMADTLVSPTARQHHPEIRTAARNMMDAVSLQAMLAVQQGLMERPDSVPTLSTIDMPICVVAAGEDQSSTPPEMRVIVDQARDTEFHLVEDAGHYAPFEQPEKFASLIGAFLDRKYRHANPDPTRKAL